jgi:type IV fimbrial biogenesis protein FimT
MHIPISPVAGTHRCNCPAGLTLLELLVALAIAGLTLAWTVSSGADWLAHYRHRSAAQALAEALALARSEAIKRGHRVTVCPSSGGLTCSTAPGWETGYLTFDDLEDDVTADSDDAVVRRASAAGHDITIRGNGPVAQYVSYTSLGLARRSNGALQMGTFTVCRPGAPAIEVVLANGGRTRIQEVAELCP